MQEIRRDDETYERFLNRFTRDRERIFAFISSLVPHGADAEDVFQRCSLVLWRKFSEFDEQQNFLTWACGVARYEVYNYLRASGRDRLRFDDDLVQQLATERIATLSRYEDRLKALGSCLKGLTGEQRRLLDAAYGPGGSVKSFAELTGSAVQTLYNRLAQLRRRLFDCIQSKLASQE